MCKKREYVNGFLHEWLQGRPWQPGRMLMSKFFDFGMSKREAEYGALGSQDECLWVCFLTSGWVNAKLSMEPLAARTNGYEYAFWLRDE